MKLQNSSTLFLKLVIIFMALAVLAICVFGIPAAIKSSDGTVMTEFVPFWIFIYLTVIPFYFALYQGIKILSYINKNTAFSQASIKALKYVKYCALAITALYIMCMPFIYKFADLDDAPGVSIVWMAITGAPIVVAVFAAVLQTLLQNVIEIKSENDLTV